MVPDQTHLESKLVYRSDTKLGYHIDTSLNHSDIRRDQEWRQTALELHTEFLKSQEANIP